MGRRCTSNIRLLYLTHCVLIGCSECSFRGTMWSPYIERNVALLHTYTTKLLIPIDNILLMTVHVFYIVKIRIENVLGLTKADVAHNKTVPSVIQDIGEWEKRVIQMILMRRRGTTQNDEEWQLMYAQGGNTLSSYTGRLKLSEKWDSEIQEMKACGLACGLRLVGWHKSDG